MAQISWQSSCGRAEGELLLIRGIKLIVRRRPVWAPIYVLFVISSIMFPIKSAAIKSSSSVASNISSGGYFWIFNFCNIDAVKSIFTASTTCCRYNRVRIILRKLYLCVNNSAIQQWYFKINVKQNKVVNSFSYISTNKQVTD